jgi:DNA-binding LacI/PurR family transcriptional regulator
LVTRRTDTIALIVSEPETRLFSEPFFAGTVRGISDELAHTDYAFVLLSAAGDITRIERYIMNGHADGMILMSLHRQDPLLQLLTRTQTPVVLGGRPFPGDNVPFVDADNRAGAAAAAQHLVTRGRKHIATIAGPADMPVGVDRLEGFRDALPAAAKRSWRRMVAHGDFSEGSGEAAMQELLERAPELDAVFAASDLMAVGAMRALRASGRKIPDDVAVVGFDDAAVAATTEPPLTTVAQPLGEMTQLMTELLLRQIEGEAAAAETRVCSTRLVRRASA